jgi:hypothetical protein
VFKKGEIVAVGDIAQFEDAANGSHGRVCHQVTILISTRLMTYVIVCIFECN